MMIKRSCGLKIHNLVRKRNHSYIKDVEIPTLPLPRFKPIRNKGFRKKATLPILEEDKDMEESSRILQEEVDRQVD